MRFWMMVKIVLTSFLMMLASLAVAKDYKGAELITHQTFKYGAFEARIRGPEGSGLITAFFLWKDGSELEGTEWQEQDFELFGKDGRYQSQVMTPGNPRTENNTFHSLPTNSYDSYYTYRMEWTPQYLAFYIDGVLVRRETDPVRYAKLLDANRAEPMQLRLNVWAGDSGWAGTFDTAAVPTAAFVDFATVYSYTPGAGPGGGDFTQLWSDPFNTIDGSRWWRANWTFDSAVNDYVGQNAAAIDGKLVLAFTNNANSGQFPQVIPADNPPLMTPEFGANQPGQPTEVDDYLPVYVPGIIEAETPKAFLDTTTGNLADAACGTLDLDAQLTADTVGGNCNLAYTRLGEWTLYEIEVEQAGDYEFIVRAAANTPGQSLTLEVDGANISGEIEVNASGWQNYGNYVVPYSLDAGTHTVRMRFTTGSINVNYIDVALAGEGGSGGGGSNPPPAYTAIPGRIEAEDYDAFFDNSPGNLGDAVCSSTDVDAQITADATGQCNLAFTRPGEYVEYNVDAQTSGEYELSFRVAANAAARQFEVTVDGVTVGGVFEVPALGWQTYSDLTANLFLAEGDHTVRIEFITGSVNVNYLDFSLISEGGGPSEPPTEEPEEPEEPDTGSCAAQTFIASQMTASTGGASGDAWNIWSNGSLSTGYDFAGNSVLLEVVAAGQQAAGVWPTMNVRVNGAVVETITVASANFASYFFSVDSVTAGSGTISVEFTNDYYQNGADRNLLVRQVIVDECL